VVHKITEDLDQRKINIGVFLDLTKAFGTIKHDILFEELEHHGIRSLALEWRKWYNMIDRF